MRGPRGCSGGGDNSPLIPPTVDQADSAGLRSKGTERRARPPGSPLLSPCGPLCPPALPAPSPVGATRRSPPGAPHSLHSVHAGVTALLFFFFLLLSLLLLVLFPYPPPPPRFPSKSGGWRREKSSLESKGAVRTDLSATEEDPRSGRALQPVGALERRARAERRLRSTRCPLGRSAPPPPSAPRSPPQHRGPGNPPARFFVQFQQSSEEVGPFVPLFIDCVNIAKRRRRSGGPSPAPRPAPRREKPQHTT